jgi:hypothetical protein
MPHHHLYSPLSLRSTPANEDIFFGRSQALPLAEAPRLHVSFPSSNSSSSSYSSSSSADTPEQRSTSSKVYIQIDAIRSSLSPRDCTFPGFFSRPEAKGGLESAEGRGTSGETTLILVREWTEGCWLRRHEGTGVNDVCGKGYTGLNRDRGGGYQRRGKSFEQLINIIRVRVK